MFLTVHAIFALIFIKYCPNLVWAFVIGFVSHFILDAIPHGDKEMDSWDEEIKTKRMPIFASVDILVMLIVWGILYQTLNLPFAISLTLAISAIIPDLISGVYLLTPKPLDNRWAKFHYYIHLLIIKPITMKIGFFIQLFFLIGSIYLLLHLYK